MTLQIQAVIVNYGTPALTRRAVWSLISLYPDLEILVVDNASPDDSAVRLADEFERRPKVSMSVNKSNIHHGPAMDAALRTAEYDWVLLFDSDAIAYRAGLIEGMLDTARIHSAYMVGELCFVDKRGFNVERGEAGHPYVHPKCALVHRSTYCELPPFERHGAPCLANQQAAKARGLELAHFPVDDYVFHQGRGTVSEYGYRLGWRSRITSGWRRLMGGGSHS